MGKDLRVLFVNNFRGRGGGEEFLRDLLPGLVQKEAAIGLVCRPNTPLAEMFRDGEISLYPLDRSGAGALTSVLAIARIIRRERYEIVDIQRGHDILQAWVAAMLSGRRPVLLYTPQVPEFIRSRLLLGRLDAVVTISRYIREKLIAFFPKLERRISIVYYGIDLDQFSPDAPERGLIRSRFGLAPDTPIIGTVGDLWKNQIEFLESLAMIRKAYPGARYALVASPSGIGQVQEFKDRAEQLGLKDAVLWVGRLSKAEMRSFYADIDIAVSTHRNEGFGIWALEVLAMGKPVVAYREGGITDALEGCPAGHLVAGGTDDMSRLIIGLLGDAERRRTMGREGARWVRERFGRERMIDDYERYFRSLRRR